MPYFSDFINAADSQIQPGVIHSQNTAAVRYYRRYLFQRAISGFKWRIPEGWELPYVLYCVYGIGYISVVDTDSFGVIPSWCTLSGLGVQYQPTHLLLNNPLIKSGELLEIGRDAALIRLQPDYGGIMDLVNDYAEAMALTSQLFSVNTLNSRLSFVFGAGDKRAAESYKAAMDELYSGSPMVVVDKGLLSKDGTPSWQLLLQDVGQNYVAAEALENLRRLECKFNNEIGIPANLATAKKERTISAEVEANDVETYSRAAMWLDSLKQGCKQVRDMFGVDVSVDWRINPMEEVRSDADPVVSRDGAAGAVSD